jgi:hypothetical protein
LNDADRPPCTITKGSGGLSASNCHGAAPRERNLKLQVPANQMAAWGRRKKPRFAYLFFAGALHRKKSLRRAILAPSFLAIHEDPGVRRGLRG